MTTYKNSKKLSPEKLFQLYKSVGWTKRVKNGSAHSKLLSTVYAHSDGVFSAWNEHTLVGVIRYITDGNAHGVIYGLAILPTYEKQGIGSTLIKKCLNTNKKIQWSTEVEAASGLFEKLGFKESKNRLFSKGNCPV